MNIYCTGCCILYMYKQIYEIEFFLAIKLDFQKREINDVEIP